MRKGLVLTLVLHRTCGLIITASMLLLPAQAAAQSIRTNAPASIGSVTLDAGARTVRMPGWVNQTSGIVELLACGPRGKTHESVLVLDVNPLDLQTALLLLNLKPPLSAATASEPGREPPAGPPVRLLIQWQENGSNRSVRAETLLYDTRTRGPLPNTHWIFSGSTEESGRFMALAEESIVATYWDPWAIINLPLPCGANDELLIVNTNTVPPLETPVTLTIEVP